VEKVGRLGLAVTRFKAIHKAFSETILHCVYAITFWYGSLLVPSGETDGGRCLSVLMVVVVGAGALGSVVPHFSVFAKACAVATVVFDTIDKQEHEKKKSLETCPSDYQHNPCSRLHPQSIQGDIEFRNVYFRYPSRPDVPILEDFSLHISAGKTVALVGGSGSGKRYEICIWTFDN
jgi:ABC-type multidrug transport system fused ATPase/permease subunit